MASICCIPTADGCADECSTIDDSHSCHYSSSDNNDGSPIKMGVKTGPHGLHALATEDIPAGTVIVQCLPLAQSPIIHGPAKPTCFRCFFQEGDDDLSGRRKTETLFRCSRCQIARYCSKECQMSDWNEGHKLECQFYVKQRKMQPDRSASDEEAAMPKALMLRTFASLKLLRDKQSVADDASVIKDAVSCGPNHFASLAVSPQHHSPTSKSTKTLNSSEMNIVKSIMMQHAIGKGKQKESSLDEQAAAALKIWGYDDHQHNRTNDKETPKKKSSFTLDQALLRTDDAFKKNNFGILDALHSSIGEGVYPCAALLNHSCAPNAILRYKLDSGDNGGKGEAFHLPLLQIIACRDIVKGEELTHSYVDLMLSTKERQGRLWKTHGFTCECKRCVEREIVIPLPQDRTLWEKWPLEHRLRAIDQGERHGQDNLVSIDLETALNQCSLGERDRAAILDCVELLTGKAHQSMLCDDVEEELNCLRSAVNLWTDKDIDWWWTPFNLSLYSARSQYFTALLANQEIEEAVDQLEFIVSTLLVAFSHVQNHPLLGLQLFTLGDLYACMGRAWGRKAYLTYFYAREIMTITHGVDHPLVLQLVQKIAERAIDN
eukprot:scaffold4458_cov189-Skeletonema_dohrnii-CCMP3373.AAC.5